MIKIMFASDFKSLVHMLKLNVIFPIRHIILRTLL